ncbi:MAG: hypothetical protein AMXMBFR13_33920 [Phycisphaerae bacterium]
MRRLTYAAASAALTILMLAGFARAEPPGDDRLSPEEFAVLPWGWTAAKPEALEEIRACGFNLAGFVSGDGLDAVAAAGLKAIVHEAPLHVGDPTADLAKDQIKDRIAPVVERVRQHPAVYGYYLRDEPSAAMFPALARFSAVLRDLDPKALPYINLFPNYASSAQLGSKSYEEHLEAFITTVKPPFVSYDHYALMDDGTLRGGYFQNLEAVRGAALKHDLPFWNIVLSNAHFRYADPSEAGFRFQVYTTLAYGARGISYFTYFAPATGNYRLAPIDQFGHKTATWDMLRNVNLQIHKLGPTYVKLRSVNVFHHPTVPDGCQGIPTARFVESLEGGQFLVGEFEGPNGQPYAMIVNTDLHKSASFTVRFKPAGRIMQVNSYTGQVHPWHGENNWLAPGQGMLLTVESPQ